MQGAKLLHVSDLLLLGRATIEESLLLLHWLRQSGHERLGERLLLPTGPASPWLAVAAVPSRLMVALHTLRCHGVCGWASGNPVPRSAAAPASIPVMESWLSWPEQEFRPLPCPCLPCPSRPSSRLPAANPCRHVRPQHGRGARQHGGIPVPRPRGPHAPAGPALGGWRLLQRRAVPRHGLAAGVGGGLLPN